MILLAAALLLDGTIEDQLRALRDDDIGRRLAAAESLVVLGEAGLDDVRTARAEAVDPETRARLDDVLDRIERAIAGRTFPGGAPVAGFTAALAARWDGDREQVVFAIEILNVDEKERPVVAAKDWDVMVPGRGWRSRGNAVRLDVQTVPESPPGPRRIRSTAFCGCGTTHARIAVQPGRVLRSEHRLGRGASFDDRTLPPGRYRARAAYYAHKLPAGAETDLETPWVEFTVP